MTATAILAPHFARLALPTEQLLLLGIDGGGTKCRAILVNREGRLLGTGLGGSANAFVDPVRTQQSMIDAAQAALIAAGLPVELVPQLQVCAGLAGVNVPRAAAAMTAWAHPFAGLKVMSDLQAACLGAHAGADGRVIVLGTGSCGALWACGALTLVGGHGLSLGDDASGAWLGREALRLHLLATDQLAPPTLISERLAHWAPLLFGAPVDDWVAFMQHGSTADFAKLCIAITEAAAAGDAAAQGALNQALDYAERLANRLQAAASAPLPLALVGGLVDLIEPDLRARFDFSAPAHPPEVGALLSLSAADMAPRAALRGASCD